MKFPFAMGRFLLVFVTPFVGVWIEIASAALNLLVLSVTPFVGVWIEITRMKYLRTSLPSLPSWECGLKCRAILLSEAGFYVTPFVGVWIEMRSFREACTRIHVTPFVGVWIEIPPRLLDVLSTSSLPSWECGLKWIY